MLIVFTSWSCSLIPIGLVKAFRGGFSSKTLLIALFNLFFTNISILTRNVYTKKCFCFHSTLLGLDRKLDCWNASSARFQNIKLLLHKPLIVCDKRIVVFTSLVSLTIFFLLQTLIFPRKFVIKKSGLLRWSCFSFTTNILFRTASFERSTKTSCDGIRFCFSARSTDSLPMCWWKKTQNDGSECEWIVCLAEYISHVENDDDDDDDDWNSIPKKLWCRNKNETFTDSNRVSINWRNGEAESRVG